MKKIARINKWAGILAFAVSMIIAFEALALEADSIIFKAMEDELSRSMSDLVMENLERPYFIVYTIDDFQSLSINSVLGTLTRSNLDRGRYLTADLRVGDPTLDNANFVAGYFDSRQNSFPITFENDYDAIRNDIYLATDKLYKSALKTLSKKKAYLQTRILSDRPADFITPVPGKYLGKTEPFDIDKVSFELLAKSASEVFRGYPEIISSSIRITAGAFNQYLVTSVGTRTLRGNRIYTIELVMSGKNAEGTEVADGDKIIIDKPEQVPDKAALVAWARENAIRMRAFLKAEKVEEYTGPVILSGAAAGEFFRQLFARNISESPSPLYEKDQAAEQNRGPELANKLKRRVLPEFISVYDDPTLDRFGNFGLIGCYEVDDIGELPQRIQLVDQGKLINIPMGLSPTRHVKESNGHARGAIGKDIAGRTANMIVESAEAVPLARLKADMLDMCRDMGLEYGIVIKELGDPNGTYGDQGYYYGGGQQNSLSPPLEAYRVFIDGREEPLGGMEFSNVTVRILRDIIQAGDDLYCHNYLIGNDNELPASIVTPSVLIEEMELKKSEAKANKPLILPSPLVKR